MSDFIDTTNDTIKKGNYTSLYAFECRTCQGGIFKKLFDNLKELLPDFNLILFPSGIKMYSTSQLTGAIIHMELDNEKFDYYNCDKTDFKAHIGMKAENLFNIFKTLGNDHCTKLFLKDRKSDKINIENCKNEKDKVKIESELNILDVQQEPLKDLSKVRYDIVITLPSKDFLQYVKTLAKDDCEDIEFVIEEDCIVLQTENNIDGSTRVVIETPPHNNTPFVNRFSYKTVSYIAKFCSISDDVLISICKNNLLQFVYGVGNLGVIRFYIPNKTEDY